MININKQIAPKNMEGGSENLNHQSSIVSLHAVEKPSLSIHKACDVNGW